MQPDAAEDLAIRVLTFLGADQERGARFLTVSGLTPNTLRSAARSPAFFLGVLDYVAADEQLLRSFATENETHPQTVMAAREALSPKLEPPPDNEGPARGSIVLQCKHCGQTEIRRRRDLPYAPAKAVMVRVDRCGPCGGGFHGGEEWLDERGREVE
jgi:hypothetical protein